MASSAVHQFSSPAEVVMGGVRLARNETAAAAGHSKPLLTPTRMNQPPFITFHHFREQRRDPHRKPRAMSRTPRA